MFAGHIGVGLAIGRVERRVNVGFFITAALLLDIVLWVFVLFGWESVSIPADFASTHQAEFVFSYSHSLAAALAWSAVAGALGFAWAVRVRALGWRVAALIAAVVFSHWLLDALVHQPELPIAGTGSHKVGLALWDNMPAALFIEAAILVLGLYLFLSGTRLSRSRSVALATLSLVVLAFTVAGMTVAPPPPSGIAMAGGSLVTLAVVCGLAYWLGRLRRPFTDAAS